MPKSAEFILEFECKQFLAVEPFGPFHEEVIQRLAENPSVQTVECTSVREMTTLARQIGVCVILAHCPDDSHAEEFVSLLQSCSKEITERKIRILITVSSDYLILLPKFIRLGAADVVQQPVSPKLLTTKVERFLATIPSRDKNGRVLPDAPKKPSDEKEPGLSWGQPLSVRSDCWMAIEGKTHWVPGANKWSVQLIGPTPSHGEWSSCDESLEPNPEAEECWEWIPGRLTDDPFIVDEGAWRYRGEKPEYRDGAWVFTGRNPKLAFVQKEAEQGSKVAALERSLQVSENSDQARSAAELIEKEVRESSSEPKLRPAFDPETVNLRAAFVAHVESPQSDSAAAPPGYLQRVPREAPPTDAKNQLSATFSPITAAFLVSELSRDRRLSPLRMLWRFCEHLKAACAYGQVEFWISSPGGWKCLQHQDLMDMSLQQKIEGSTWEKVIRVEGTRAVVIRDGNRNLGALLFVGVKASVYTDFEIESYGKIVNGIVVGLREDPFAA